VPNGEQIESVPSHRPTRSRPKRITAGVIAVVAVLSLIASACGDGRSDSGDDNNGGTDTTEASTDSGQFGDLASPCGEGDATGATAQGVTDTEITIGYGDDAGFQTSPGLNAEMSDAVDAMIQWCNEQGGINGRQVVGNYYDAKITEVNNVMTEACEQVFMLVGQGWSLDSGQEETRLACGLPSVPGFSVSPAFAHGDMMFQPVPNPVDRTPIQIAYAIAEAFPDEIKNSAVMYANYAATIDTKDKVLASYPAAGFEFLPCPQEYNIGGEADWKPFAQNLKDCGAEVVYFTGSPYPNFQNFLEAAGQIGFQPIYITDANFYDPKFAQWNAAGLGDNVYVRMAFTPFEEASDSPATQQYLDIVEEAGGTSSLLGAQSASAFLLWASAVKECGSDVTRECVVEKLSAVSTWDGGGLHAEASPGSNEPPECGMVLKLEGTEYVRFAPDEVNSFDCSPEYVAEVTGPVVDQANLDADRISRAG
jgi:ABC-type branched-subunit amino acid transport system substrate-binding protein